VLLDPADQRLYQLYRRERPGRDQPGQLTDGQVVRLGGHGLAIVLQRHGIVKGCAVRALIDFAGPSGYTNEP
jgi:hypothetical protein